MSSLSFSRLQQNHSGLWMGSHLTEPICAKRWKRSVWQVAVDISCFLQLGFRHSQKKNRHSTDPRDAWKFAFWFWISILDRQGKPNVESWSIETRRNVPFPSCELLSLEATRDDWHLLAIQSPLPLAVPDLGDLFGSVLAVLGTSWHMENTKRLLVHLHIQI